jgi:hypothetical protein
MVRSEYVMMIAIAVAGCVDTSSPDGATADQRARLRDPIVRTTLLALGTDHAAAAGAPITATMVAVAASDHQAAETVISGALIADHVPVYVVQMTGGPYTVTHHRDGAAAPQGDVLTVTLDAADYRVTDIGYDLVAPDLSLIDADVVDLLAP